MQIKQKLILSTVLLVVSLSLMVFLQIYSLSTNKSLMEGIKVSASMDKDILELRKHEKDFFARKNEKYVARFGDRFATLEHDVSELKRIFTDFGLPTSDIDRFQQVITKYHQKFKELGALQKKIGYDKESGLIGQLRQSAKVLEQKLSSKELSVQNALLLTRRAEKDFLMRKESSYLDKHAKSLTRLEQQLYSAQDKQILAAYKNAFSQLTESYIAFGLNEKLGVMGEMRKTVHSTESILTSLVELNEKEIKASTQQVRTLVITLFIVILIVGVVASMMTSRSILNPINELRELMISIGQSKNLTLRAVHNNDDEISQMAQHFNEMVGQFQALITEVEQSVGTLNNATESLAQNVAITTDGVQSQMVETDMVATAVTEMVATIDEIAHNTSDTASKAQVTNSNAQLGQEGVDKTINQIKQLSSNLLDSENEITQLETDSQSIGSVVDVIRGIADQTNLLALNAAIEAARAGEQGRGFAVVADEVRSLASKTQESTSEIEGIILQFQSRTSQIVTLMAQCRDQGEISAEQAAATGEMLAEITQDVSTILDMTTSVAAAIEEQSSVAAEVNRHIVSIRDVTEQTSTSSDQNAQMSEEVSQQAVVLSDSVEQFTVR